MESLGEANDSDDPEKLWTDFKNKILKVSEGCLRDTPGRFKSFLTKEILNIIEKSLMARLEGGLDRELKREAVRAVRWDKEAQVRGICETVESHLWPTDSRPAYKGIRKLRSTRPPLRCSTVKAADGTTLTGESEIRARWAGNFEKLYPVPPRP